MVGGRRGQQTSQLDEIAVIIIVFPGSVCILIQFDTPACIFDVAGPSFLSLVSSTANVYFFGESKVHAML